AFPTLVSELPVERQRLLEHGAAPLIVARSGSDIAQRVEGSRHSTPVLQAAADQEALLKGRLGCGIIALPVGEPSCSVERCRALYTGRLRAGVREGRPAPLSPLGVVSA